jgi:hypothetical protein
VKKSKSILCLFVAANNACLEVTLGWNENLTQFLFHLAREIGINLTSFNHYKFGIEEDKQVWLGTKI